MTISVQCPLDRTPMVPEERAGVALDRCPQCAGLWFDAAELDRVLAEAGAESATPLEARIPARGLGTRRCPRCDGPLRPAGWTGLVLDRCPACRGLFVEAGELAQLERGAPGEGDPFEVRLRGALLRAGWALLMARGLAALIVRVLR